MGAPWQHYSLLHLCPLVQADSDRAEIPTYHFEAVIGVTGVNFEISLPTSCGNPSETSSAHKSCVINDLPRTTNTHYLVAYSTFKMDNILPSILSFPPHPAPLVPLSDSQYDAGIKSQIETLKKIPEKILLQSTTGGESPLDVSSGVYISTVHKLTFL